MTQDQYLDDILEAIKHDLINQNPPTATRNKNNKIITVKSDSCLGEIKDVKILADYGTWLQSYNQAENLRFEDIKNYLKHQEILPMISKYYSELPDSFMSDFYSCLDPAL